MSQSKSTEWMKHWSKVVEKAWHDEGFKKRLLSNPAAVLKAERYRTPTRCSGQVGREYAECNSPDVAR